MLPDQTVPAVQQSLTVGAVKLTRRGRSMWRIPFKAKSVRSNAALRDVRKSRGELGRDHSFETKHGRGDFAAGDDIQFTETAKTPNPKPQTEPFKRPKPRWRIA